MSQIDSNTSDIYNANVYKRKSGKEGSPKFEPSYCFLFSLKLCSFDICGSIHFKLYWSIFK